MTYIYYKGDLTHWHNLLFAKRYYWDLHNLRHDEIERLNILIPILDKLIKSC